MSWLSICQLLNRDTAPWKKLATFLFPYWSTSLIFHPLFVLSPLLWPQCYFQEFIIFISTVWYYFSRLLIQGSPLQSYFSSNAVKFGHFKCHLVPVRSYTTLPQLPKSLPESCPTQFFFHNPFSVRVLSVFSNDGQNRFLQNVGIYQNT